MMPVLITDAEPSAQEKRRRREIRYMTMMGLRVICLVTAVLLTTHHVGLPWLWAPACVLGMVLLPWFAVQIANEPNRRRARSRSSLPLRPALPSSPASIEQDADGAASEPAAPR
jgi:Flp pilus assembly protein TadB